MRHTTLILALTSLCLPATALSQDATGIPGANPGGNPRGAITKLACPTEWVVAQKLSFHGTGGAIIHSNDERTRSFTQGASLSYRLTGATPTKRTYQLADGRTFELCGNDTNDLSFRFGAGYFNLLGEDEHGVHVDFGAGLTGDHGLYAGLAFTGVFTNPKLAVGLVVGYEFEHFFSIALRPTLDISEVLAPATSADPDFAFMGMLEVTLHMGVLRENWPKTLDSIKPSE